ncbi:uncharacterized protein EV420DRAFT_1637759 [Desarmillaria tabescens]|uniref:MYND-type domain-containing protein n=1 Tax=Armillaria tabescens TaxID=1929756 RepID=A0AA39NEL0_ARMTA|nr:uncharacterized protein EV420DRAFT_1637759 [Desarmillaria tabescens]KAK0464195.1 hypothetical protein EV420DRAFT_1637759 [Desarmillaria tabescens]
MNEDKQSFISLKAKVRRNRYVLPKLFGILQRRFEECPTDSILFDTETQDLYETFFRGLRDLLQSSKNEILRPNGNGDLFQARYDSECLDESTIWVVIEQLYEFIYSLLRADDIYSREIASGPYISITSHLYLKAVQSYRPLLHLEFLLEKPLLRFLQVVANTPSARYEPFADTAHSLMMSCFQRIVARVQDPTISFDARLRAHAFVYTVSLSSDGYNRIFLANRALYWFSLSIAHFLPFITANPTQYGPMLVPNMNYLARCLRQSGPEYMAEALDAGILNTLLNLHLLMPRTSDAPIDIINWLHMGLVFRGVLRRARRALDNIEQDGTESILRSGKTKEAWMAMKTTAKHMQAFKSYYHTQVLDNDQELECNNVQCPNPNVGRHPKRCTGCWIRLFCSRACQKAGWKAHRHECHDLAQRRRDGISGPMGEHDSFYVRQCALEELKANARHVRDLKREYLQKHSNHPLRRLVVVCDYALLPRTITIISNEDLEEEATSPEPLADADEGRAQILRIITPWKGGPAGMLLNVMYTPEYRSDEHLVMSGL